MRRLLKVAMLAILFCLTCSIGNQRVGAISPNIVISQVQLGDAVSASNEFVELYNNSDDDVEVTDWCLYYASATSTILGSKMACIVPGNDTLHLYLPAKNFIFAISSALAASSPAIGSDLTFSATLSGTSGHLRLINKQAVEIDKVGWGTAASPETLAITTAPVGKILQRKIIAPNILQDTDNNSLDFELSLKRTSYVYGSIYEVQDLCANIPDIQTSVPSGYTTDGSGNCLPPPVDICLNIDGVQTILPVGYELDDSGKCVNLDLCPNLDNVQLVIPEGYHFSEDGQCLIDLPTLKINELLANAVGNDDGNEYIEIYNPNDEIVDLSFYKLQVGSGSEKTYSFPLGNYINPHEYKIFTDKDINFTLVNSGSIVSILNTYDDIVDTSTYGNSDEGMAWALIGSTWQFTNQPTPGSSNLASLEDIVTDNGDVLGAKICAPNQYLNPDTNRCRLIVVETPCKDGQYRSEETNRCRSIATDASVIQLCAENQERNPETNRCRLITSVTSEPTPCKEGQERNPETNRCRNIVSTIPEAEYRVEPIPVIRNSSDVWILVGVLVVAFGYAVWEWRYEIKQLLSKIQKYFHSSK